MEQSITHPVMYVNPMIDVAFKYLFGTEKHKNLLKGLLEHVFGREIEDINYDNTEQISDSLTGRSAYFDVYCKAAEGPDFIVECQLKSQEFFTERAVYYASRVISNQAPLGGVWNYNFRPVYFLGLMNFPLPGKDKDSIDYVHSFSIRNDRSGTQMTDKLRFVFMEVGPFSKPLEECETFEDKFLFYMKNLPTFAEKPNTQSDKYFEELLQTAEYLGMDMDTQASYERRLKEMRDIKNVEDFARKQAIEEGMAEGREKGLAEGMAEGREKGLAEGRAEERQEIVRSLLANGASHELIARSLKITIDEVKELAADTPRT